MPSKKEIRLILNPVKQRQEADAAASADEDQQQQQLLQPTTSAVTSKASALSDVYTARIALAPVVKCCATIKNLSEMLRELSQNRPSSSRSKKKKNNDMDTSTLTAEQIALGATGFLTGEHHSSSSSSGAGGAGSSFLSEMPSVLPLDLPLAACSEPDTLRLYCEWHCGADYNRMELCKVTGWGTASESAVEIGLGVGSSSSVVQRRSPSPARQQHHHKDSRYKYTRDRDNQASSSSSSSSSLSDDDDDDAADASSSFAGKDIHKQHHGSHHHHHFPAVEHATLSALALTDRNPAVIFAAPSSAAASASSQQGGGGGGGSLPAWERKWVQDNFLALDSPACCARAARVAALAEFMGCAGLTDMMAAVIASRLCERHNPSTDHMRWCLQGIDLQGFASQG